jgi:FixJ family two-component response regulator
MPLLTQRERQVLERVVQGASSKEIAHALDLSPRTVELYRSSLLHKLGARNAADLVRKMLSASQM